MNKYRNLKIGFYAAAFSLLSLGVHAQTLPNTPTPPTATHYTEFTAGAESVDSVTVGSRMPYKVEQQTPPPMSGLDVEYKWLFSPATTIKSLTGTTNLASVNNDDYYAENEISVVMPASPTDLTIKTNVRYKSGTTALCEGTADDTNKITVVNRPTIQWTAGEILGCEGAGTTATIPVTLTGYKQFEVAYQIEHWSAFDKSGTPNPSEGWMVLAGDELDFPATMFDETGVYEITVTNITDRISRKSLDVSLVAAQSSDLPSGVYTVKIYPVPVTNPLQHIKNVQ